VKRFGAWCGDVVTWILGKSGEAGFYALGSTSCSGLEQTSNMETISQRQFLHLEMASSVTSSVASSVNTNNSSGIANLKIGQSIIDRYDSNCHWVDGKMEARNSNR
jgi:hypothetical protein